MSLLSVSSIQNPAAGQPNILLNADGSVTLPIVSGAAPAQTQAGTLWFDIAGPTLNIRNAANTAWLPVSAGSSATPLAEGTVYGLTEPISGGTLNVSLGEAALASATGSANTAVGTGAGTVLTSGSFNTYVGAGAGSTDVTGTNNIALGFNTLNGFDGGASNVVIGWGAGSVLTNESGNVILGGYTGQVGLSDHVFLASGTGTLRVTINDQGAIAFDGSNYGAAGDVLTSGGTGGAPQWVTGDSGSFTAGAQTITVVNGIITSIV